MHDAHSGHCGSVNVRDDCPASHGAAQDHVVGGGRERFAPARHRSLARPLGNRIDLEPLWHRPPPAGFARCKNEVTAMAVPDPTQALEDLNEEALLPNPVKVRDMLFHAKLAADQSLELNRQFTEYQK